MAAVSEMVRAELDRHDGLTGGADEAEMASDIIEFIDLDEERSAHYQSLLRDRVRARTKRRRAV
ncbi:hypothetical protein [Streptomyces sp. NPDC050428]|uniref:hypothetical protein n=1 Tax=Streptomyces sp. NPDC050428 TaxID=3155757 RepID=UPI003432ECC7